MIEVPPTPSLSSDVQSILAGVRPLPATRRTQPVLVMTVGLPGSGKSTFSRRLAPDIDAVILESDAIRARLTGRPTHSLDENWRVFGALHTAARELLTTGVSVVIDSTSLTEANRRPVRDLAVETGARLITLQFSADRAVIEERLKQRRQAPTGAYTVAGLAVYKRLARRVEPVREDHWQIDTSDPLRVDAIYPRVVESCREQALAAGSRGGRS
jgi:predicted kinase